MSGPAGATGPTGLQGLRGLQGPPRYAYPGLPYGPETARITVVTPTSSPIYLTPQNFGTYYSITNAAVSGIPAPLTISFPFYNPTYADGTPTNIISSAWSGTTLTINTSTNHTLRALSLVTITGMTGNTVGNGSNIRVQTINSPTQFTITTSTSGSTGTISDSGTVTERTAVETTNEAYPTPEQEGSFWVFKNNYGNDISVTFSNGSVTNKGSSVTTMTLGFGYKITVLYAGNGFIVL